jgi:hypothetical protein
MEVSSTILHAMDCHVRRQPYRLLIVAAMEHSQSIESSEFLPTEVPIEKVRPSPMSIVLEPLNVRGRKSKPPQSIPLNHLLSAQQSTIIFNRRQRTMVDKQSRRSTMTGNSFEMNTPQSSSGTRRQSRFSRFLSLDSMLKSDEETIVKSLVNLSYVDVSNSIRWNIKHLNLEFDDKELAAQVCVNLNLCLAKLEQRPRRLLVFVNPQCGKGNASASIF